MAQVCVRHEISVDILFGSQSYVDVASLAPLCKYTGGQVHTSQNAVTYMNVCMYLHMHFFASAAHTCKA
jgi:hypothetical protein